MDSIGTEKKKSFRIRDTREADDDDQLYVTHLTKSVFGSLKTCVPFHFSSNGALINDTGDVDQLGPVNLADPAPSAKAPSQAGLLLNNDDDDERRTAIYDEHELTIEEIKAGLRNIGRTKNGYEINFTELNLSNRGLGDISLVQYFTGLTFVDISVNYIADVSVLGSMPYLRRVDASRNDLKVFGAFRAPVALKEVNFSRNRITKLVNLNHLWALTQVNLSHNELTTVEGFEQCKFLRILDLSHNKISTIQNLKCPSLVALLLHNNNIDEIMNLDGCHNLRALSLAQNKITCLRPLRNLALLTELWIQNNKIGDLFELQHIKCQLHLSSLFIDSNPINSMGLWRRMLIFIIPQLRYLDGQLVEAEESMLAKNTFSPSYSKIALETRVSVLLDRSCQAANMMLDHNVNPSSVPPILLITGAPFSRCNTLTALLKEKYQSKVQLGGVHSTATTLEFRNTNIDIPVSYETFMHMKGRGEFLATSHILGRACGFTTAQVTRASERSAVLVACAPLGVALTLRKWGLKPKIVLVMPTGKVGLTPPPLGPIGHSTIDKETTEVNQETTLNETSWIDSVNDVELEFSEIDRNRHSLPVVQFAPGKTTFDMDERGKKRPSLMPYDGPGLLKIREDFNDFGQPIQNRKQSLSPGLLKLSEGDRKFESDYSQTMKELKGQHDDENDEVEEKNPHKMIMEWDDEHRRQNEGKDNTALNLQNFKDFEYSSPPPVSKNTGAKTAEKTDLIGKTHTDPSSDLLQFLTNSENPDQSPFPTTKKINKFRRIASLFLEVGGQNLMDMVMNDFPDRPSQHPLMNRMDWNKTLLDLQLEELNSSQAYYMTINKFTKDEDHSREKQKQPACGPRTMMRRSIPNNVQQKCTIAIGKEGVYQCLLSKNDSGESAGVSDQQQMITSAHHKNSVEQSIFAGRRQSRSSPELNLTAHEPVPLISVTSAADDAHLEDTVQLRNAIDKGESGREEEKGARNETTKIKTACHNVFNPYYAFGPREICCQESRLKKCQNETNLPCCLNDWDRGIFFDGTFRKNFLDPQTPSNVSVNNDQSGSHDSDIWGGESGAAGAEGLYEDVSYEVNQQQMESFQSPTVKDDDDESCTIYSTRVDNDSSETAGPSSLSSDHGSTPSLGTAREEHHRNYVDEYPGENEEEMYGEDGDMVRYSTVPPPPSRDSTNDHHHKHHKFEPSETDNIDNEDNDNSSKDSDDNINKDLSTSDVNQPKRKLRPDRTESCILNSREEYAQFYRDHPGVIHAVIDSINIDQCLEVLTVIVDECLQAIKISSGSKKCVTYAHRNKSDSVQFLKHRISEHKTMSTVFSKGYSHPSQLSKVPRRRHQDCHGTPLYFQESKCPVNLLESFVARRTRNAKIQKIIQ